MSQVQRVHSQAGTVQRAGGLLVAHPAARNSRALSFRAPQFLLDPCPALIRWTEPCERDFPFGDF